MARPILLAAACVLAIASAAHADLLARVTVITTDLGGTPISTIDVGEDFLLQVFVQDIRNPPAVAGGIAAGYLNVDYDGVLVSISPSAPIEYDPFFTAWQTGNLDEPGRIVGAGAYSISFEAPGTALQALFSIPATATAPGGVAFTPSFFEAEDGRNVLLFVYDSPLLESEIDFVGATLSIVPEPSGIVAGTCGVLALAVCCLRRQKRSAMHDRGREPV
ncbi:MAG: hypothetical protein AB7O59_00755 [Pirellulales bacterium]